MILLGGAAAHFPGAPLGFQSGAAQAYTAAVNISLLTAGLHFPRKATEHPACQFTKRHKAGQLCEKVTVCATGLYVPFLYAAE